MHKPKTALAVFPILAPNHYSLIRRAFIFLSMRRLERNAMTALNGKFLKKISDDLTALYEPVPSEDMVVFSHLRWNFVMQRPQHIMNRMAKDRRILFVEEPVPAPPGSQAEANSIQVSEGITVIQPYAREGLGPEATGRIVESYMGRIGIHDPILWLYSANFVDMVPLIPKRRLVVYDCMDELSAFRGADPALVKKERALLALADVVFTGGKSLYESKKQVADSVFCFPSSVDRKHFEKVLSKRTPIPEQIATLASPVVGYYGVIDERIDAPLLRAVSEALPSVSFAMVGPVVKVSEDELPHAPNIHYLGQQSYENLPNFLKGFDVAMMPFALNAATEFISPTKTLEFMAAGKPIISTPIRDVVRDYKHAVSIVRSPEEFVNALYAYLYESALAKRRRRKAYESILNATSWDNTVDQMKQIMHDALEHKAESQMEMGSGWAATAIS